MRPPRWLAIVGLVAACGQSASVPAPTANASTAVARAPAAESAAPAHPTPGPPAPSSSLGTEDEASLANFIEHLRVVNRTSARFSNALSNCPRADETCAIGTAASYDTATRGWTVLSAYQGESGLAQFWLGTVTAAGEQPIATGLVSVEGLRILQREVALRAEAPYSPNEVERAASAEFSITSYEPFVALHGDLSGCAVYVHTSPLHDRRYNAELVRLSDRSATHLGERAAIVGPCDGDGWFCEAGGAGNRCTEAQLQAEHRLCLLPMHVDSVVIAPDRSSILVVGSSVEAGHSEGDTVRFYMPLGEEARARLSACGNG